VLIDLAVYALVLILVVRASIPASGNIAREQKKSHAPQKTIAQLDD
jgi:hypothetical protein